MGVSKQCLHSCMGVLQFQMIIVFTGSMLVGQLLEIFMPCVLCFVQMQMRAPHLISAACTNIERYVYSELLYALS